MDYEKAYKDALKRAKYYHDRDNIQFLENIFPELAESEDEQVRKKLICFVENWKNHNPNSPFDDSPIFTSNNDECDKILAWLEKQGEPIDKGEISDGYHTFNELYYYRMLYNAAFFNLLPKEWVHKSKRHHDGEECFGGGWFIVMANLPTGQISNHYELKDWDLFQIPEREVANEWDGHTPQEAAERLHKYLLEKQGQSQVKESSILQHEGTHEDASCKENDNSLTREQKPQRFISAEAKEALYGEPTAWSERDERFLNQVMEEVDYALNDKDMFYSGASPIIDWLKSLKQRLGGGE